MTLNFDILVIAVSKISLVDLMFKKISTFPSSNGTKMTWPPGCWSRCTWSRCTTLAAAKIRSKSNRKHGKCLGYSWNMVPDT